jgi:hypothetical protein
MDKPRFVYVMYITTTPEKTQRLSVDRLDDRRLGAVRE